MQLKQNPFSLYDVLGYLVPGVTTLYGLTVLYSLSKDSTSLSKILSNSQILASVDLTIPFFILSYILGHMLSYISSVTVEKFSIWTVGYPSQYLFWNESPGYLDVDEAKRLRIFLRKFVWGFLLPISFLDHFLNKKFEARKLYAKKLDDTLTEVILLNVIFLLKNQFNRNGKQLTNDRQGDFFRIVYHYALENAPAHTSKMQNYVALYGFTRTLSLISVIFFWISFISTFLFIVPFFAGLGVVLVSVLSSFLLYCEFNKFYRKFTLEAYMAFSVSFKSRPIDKTL